jgi:uncharacterized membrane protein
MVIDLRAAAKKSTSDIQSQDQKIENYFQKKDLKGNFMSDPQQENEEEQDLEEKEYEEYAHQQEIGEILHQWQGAEFEEYEKSTRWYIVFAIFIIAIIIYALVMNSPIMAITFILLGVIGYIYLQKSPRTITFAITTEGIVADKELYAFENIKSFWIFYNPPHQKILSLHTKATMLPFVHIPFGDEDPNILREKIISYIQEKKQEQSIISTLERIFHI